MTPRKLKAFTLIELAVVMAVLGVVALAATSMLGSSRVVNSIHERSEADVLVNAMRMARATSITSGQPVRIETIRSGGVIGFRVVDPRNELVQPEHRFPEGLNGNWSANSVEFQPMGTTDRSLRVVFTGATSDWILDVLSGSGQVTLRQQFH